MEMKFAKNNLYGTKCVLIILISVIILLLTGCGSNEHTNSSANSINEDTKEETDIQKESEKMEFDLETVKREGFMIHGTPSDTVPDGYIGIFTLEDLKKLTAGGLVAEISLAFRDASGYCSINNCYNMADIKSSREAGGIVGKVEVSNPMDTTVYIAACENYGQISGNEGIGGILGSFDYIGKYEKGMYGAAARYLYYDIYNCFNYASVGA